MPALLCLPCHVLSLREGDPDYLQHCPSERVTLHSPECCAWPLAPRSSACAQLPAQASFPWELSVLCSGSGPACWAEGHFTGPFSGGWSLRGHQLVWWGMDLLAVVWVASEQAGGRRLLLSPPPSAAFRVTFIHCLGVAQPSS